MSARVLTTKTKLLVSAALLAGAASAAGLGTFGSFTSTTSASQSVTAGTVVIGVGTAGTANNRLSVAATGVVPGDTIQRTVQLNNTGNQNLASITLTTTASPSSLLDTDATNGLQLVIQKCSSTWTEAGTAPAYTYTCGGTTTTVLASRAVIGANIALSGLSAVTAGASDNLMATLTLPASAGNTFQGLASTVTFAFTGTQRAATNQ
jgi:predicted ribosomally synthesized peptide with SipW-like signal peptide